MIRLLAEKILAALLFRVCCLSLLSLRMHRSARGLRGGAQSLSLIAESEAR